MTTYTEAVEEAAAALKRGEDANWELARLTYENTLMQGNAMSQPGKVNMEQWCADVRRASGRRFSAKSGRVYKAIWSEYGRHLDGDHLPWSEAYDGVQGGTVAERFEKTHARNVTEKASVETKVQVARELLAEPEVAEAVVADQATRNVITDHIAADRRHVAEVVSKRHDVTPHIRPDQHWSAEQRPKRDYDALVEQHVNGLSVVLAAESSGNWKPSERSEALLYFLTQILGNRREPTGAQADLVDQRLQALFDEVEAFANSEAS